MFLNERDLPICPHFSKLGETYLYGFGILIHMIKDVDKLIKKSEEILPSEELFLDAVRDLMKDEIKEYLREQMKENPEIKDDLRNAMLMYVEAKVKESESMTILLKTMGKLGILTLPPEMKDEIISTMYSSFKKEIDEIIEKTL